MANETGWVEVNSSTDEMWDEKEPIEGVYKSVKHDVGPNNSNIYVLDVAGKTVGVWGTTVLDGRIPEVPFNSIIRIEPLGTARSKSGSTYKNFKVLYKDAPFMDISPMEAE